MACVWTDSWPVCAAGLAFGTYANEGRCFWQFSSAKPGILREIKKAAPYKAFYPPLFTLPELLHLKATVADFAGLSDEQVRDAYAIMGGVARPVLLLQSMGEKSLAELRDDVKAKIAEMGENGWKVRRGAAWAARTWDARAPCYLECAHAWNDQSSCASACVLSPNHKADVMWLQSSTHCLSLACHVSTFTSVPRCRGCTTPWRRTRAFMMAPICLSTGTRWTPPAPRNPESPTALRKTVCEGGHGSTRPGTNFGADQ